MSALQLSVIDGIFNAGKMQGVYEEAERARMARVLAVPPLTSPINPTYESLVSERRLAEQYSSGVVEGRRLANVVRDAEYQRGKREGYATAKTEIAAKFVSADGEQVRDMLDRPGHHFFTQKYVDRATAMHFKDGVEEGKRDSSTSTRELELLCMVKEIGRHGECFKAGALIENCSVIKDMVRWLKANGLPTWELPS